MNISRKSGLYIHIPFCLSKCGYCDFYSIVDTALINTFIDALLTEIKLSALQYHIKDRFDTVYIGGGTPSLLFPGHIRNILDTISEYFYLDKDCEITSEINPGTLDTTQLKELLDLGINRLSIGIQSFIEDELKTLERTHSVEDSINTISACRQAGFDNINLDLIFAIPNQTTFNWNYTLEKALSFLPEHMSVYNLTYEKETPFYKKMKAGQINQLDEQTEIDYFSKAHDLLSEAGYIHYEVSNYAKTDARYSRHSFKYWQHIPYLGFGPSAHSFWNHYRWANIRSVHDYITKIDNGQLPKSFEEKLTKHQLISEHIFLALRTYQGLSLAGFEKRFEKKFSEIFSNEMEKLIENKLAVIQDEYFKLTKKGMFICDEILLQFTIDK
jgi:oxygen-independent coproporphyrinogen-3 oxidase